jgi:single-strand DNA-binding protein
MNKVVLIGRLTRDPELRYTQGGDAVATFTLAVNRNFKNKDGKYDADFINIVVWRKQAENIANYLSKGRQAAVSGRIQTRTYKDKDDKTVYVTEVIANEVQFLDSKNSSNKVGTISNNLDESEGTPTTDKDFFPIEDDYDIPF